MKMGSLNWGFVRLLRALGLGLIGRCPVCGQGRLFKAYFTINDTCSHCQARFSGSGNQSTGAMGINVVLTILLGFIGGILLVINYPTQVGWGLLILFLGLTIFHIIFYHFAYGMWIGILALTGALDEDADVV